MGEYMILARDCFDVICCRPREDDGKLIGRVIRSAGTWDGWAMPRHDHRTMRKVAIDVTYEEALEAVVEAWRRKPLPPATFTFDERSYTNLRELRDRLGVEGRGFVEVVVHDPRTGREATMILPERDR